MSSGTFSPALDSSAALTGRSVRECPTRPSSRWSDLDRPALDGPALAAALTRDSALWRTLEVVEEIGSTNAALAAAAADGRPRGAGARRRAPGGRPGPAGPGLDVAAAGRPHRLVPAAPRRPGRPARLAAAADRGGAGRGGRRGDRRPRLAQVAQRPARRRRPQAGRHPRRERRARRSSSASASTSTTTADELPDTGTSLARVLGAPVDRGPVLLGLPARGRAALPPLDRGPRRPGLLRPGPGLPGLVVDGRHRGRGEPAGRLDARGDGARRSTGTAGWWSPPRRARSSWPRGTCGTCDGCDAAGRSLPARGPERADRPVRCVILGGMAYPDKLLAEDEEVVRHLHPHWLTLFWPVVLVPRGRRRRLVRHGG